VRRKTPASPRRRGAWIRVSTICPRISAFFPRRFCRSCTPPGVCCTLARPNRDSNCCQLVMQPLTVSRSRHSRTIRRKNLTTLPACDSSDSAPFKPLLIDRNDGIGVAFGFHARRKRPAALSPLLGHASPLGKGGAVDCAGIAGGAFADANTARSRPARGDRRAPGGRSPTTYWLPVSR
jgi:hypothetical protein